MHRDQQHSRFEDLEENVQLEVRAGLQKELELNDLPHLGELLQFEVADVPLKGHDTHALGRLAQFLDEIYPQRAFRITPIYRALLSEVAVRNNNQELLSSYEDLIRLKSISRRRFGELLIMVGVTTMELKWDTIEGRLNSEGAPLSLVQGLRREWEAVELDRISRADVVHLRLREIVNESCKKHRAVPRLVDVIDIIYAEIESEVKPVWTFSEMYVKACVVMGVYEPE
jgi:hypothetical protein